VALPGDRDGNRCRNSIICSRGIAASWLNIAANPDGGGVGECIRGCPAGVSSTSRIDRQAIAPAARTCAEAPGAAAARIDAISGSSADELVAGFSSMGGTGGTGGTGIGIGVGVGVSGVPCAPGEPWTLGVSGGVSDMTCILSIEMDVNPER
jgi:hypothetical protein